MKSIYARLHLRVVFQIVVLIAATIVLLPQLLRFFENTDQLKSLNIYWLIAATAAFLLTYISGALVYHAISDRKLNFRRTLLVQTATGFTNRLLPSGIGGLGTFASYLLKTKHTKSESIILVIANNALGFIAFALVLFVSGVLTPSFISELFNGVKPAHAWATAILLTLSLLVFVVSSSIRNKVSYNVSRASLALLKLAVNPRKLFGGIGASILITITSVLTLHLCLISADINLSLADVVFVFAICTLAIGVSPTPGGLGAAELGLVVALARVGQDSAMSLAAVAAYRLISFWLPILPGYLAFRYATEKKYI